MDSVTIPDKTFFKIGEVAKILGLEPYVLRYWETEFEQLRPNKTKTGQRAYQRRDIDLLLEIRGLLHEDLYTIAGARRRLVLFRQGELPLSEQNVDAESRLDQFRDEILQNKEVLATLSVENSELRHLLEAEKAARAELVATNSALEVRLSEVNEQAQGADVLLAARDELESRLRAQSIAHENVVQDLLAQAEVLRAQAEEMSNASPESEELEMLERHAAIVTQERDELKAAFARREQRRRRAVGAIRLELQHLKKMAT